MVKIVSNPQIPLYIELNFVTRIINSFAPIFIDYNYILNPYQITNFIASSFFLADKKLQKFSQFYTF